MRVIIALAFCLVAVAAVPKNSQRIIGGSVTTISNYPSIGALMHSSDLSTYVQACTGTILNQRSLLTAAQCVYGDEANKWRVRFGSTYANSGGVVLNVDSLITHGNFDPWIMDSDIAIVRTASYISYVNDAIQPAAISGSTYDLNGGEVVWTAGWGTHTVGGAPSEQLSHVQIWIVNRVVCNQRYVFLDWPVTDAMLCSGVLDEGGRGQCEGDTGSPLYHNGVVVGVYSWAYQCGHASYPGVNTRVSSFTSWIQENA